MGLPNPAYHPVRLGGFVVFGADSFVVRCRNGFAG